MVCDDKLVDTEFNLVIGQVLKEKRLSKDWSLLELSRKLNNKISVTLDTYTHLYKSELLEVSKMIDTL